MASFEGIDDVLALSLGGDHDHGKIACRAHLANEREHIQAAHFRHHHVQQDKIVRLTVQQLQPASAAVGQRDREAFELEPSAQHVSIKFFVVNQQ